MKKWVFLVSAVLGMSNLIAGTAASWQDIKKKGSQAKEYCLNNKLLIAVSAVVCVGCYKHYKLVQSHSQLQESLKKVLNLGTTNFEWNSENKDHSLLQAITRSMNENSKDINNMKAALENLTQKVSTIKPEANK